MNPRLLIQIKKENSLSHSLSFSGARLDVRTKIGQTPLHLGIFAEWVPVCDVLLELGADIKVASEEGTCEDLALQTRNTELKELFQSYLKNQVFRRGCLLCFCCGCFFLFCFCFCFFHFLSYDFNINFFFFFFFFFLILNNFLCPTIGNFQAIRQFTKEKGCYGEIQNR